MYSQGSYLTVHMSENAGNLGGYLLINGIGIGNLFRDIKFTNHKYSNLRIILQLHQPIHVFTVIYSIEEDII